MNAIPIFVGFDPREAVAYSVFCHSVLTRTSQPVAFIPLAKNALGYEGRRDGSNAFTYSRFLVPHLMGYKGWALYADGDMLCQADIVELWAKRDHWRAVQVAQHNYQTKSKTKYLGAKNEDYPRKNWSSLILWNCAHYGNRNMTPEWINSHNGEYLHRFQWLDDTRIGELPKEWNWLVGEYPENKDAKLLHYTIGIPAFGYPDHATEWYNEYDASDTPT